ncbi:MAG: 16S rRNA (cytosine(1402)-N(4))-methyltransferase RsmH [Patescibacteria group bacterium]
MTEFLHKPVLLNEVLEAFDYLKDKKNAVFVDGTLGLGGHSMAIAEKWKMESGKWKVVAIDKDEEALRIAKLRAKDHGLQTNFVFIHDDFHNIDGILDNLKINKINGMLLDLGVSSMQLDYKDRGFSFENPNAPLDMRMDSSQIQSAKDILNNYSISDLEGVLIRGEEKYFKSIARNIAEVRKEKPFRTIGDLLEILKKSIPKKTNGKNFATDTFRALRIEVNDELAPLEKTIEAIVPHLNSGARLSVITFHSLEDRIVKQTFRKLENPCTCPPEFPYCTCGNKPSVKLVSKKAIEPNTDEIAGNPRARSAKLRIVEKI